MADQSPLVSSENQDGTRKKITLEDLSKEDLVKQVKKQLILLQKSKSKCDELNLQITTLKKENDELKAFEETENGRSHFEQSIMEKDADMERMHSAIEKLKEQLASSEMLFSTVQKEKQSLQEQLECITMKTETLSDTCQVLQQENSSLQQQQKELSSQLEVLTEARDTSLNSLKELKNQLNASQEQTDFFHQQLTNSQEDHQLLMQKLEDCYAQLKTSSEQNENMQDDYAQMRTKWRDAEDECENLRLRIEQLEVTNQEEEYLVQYKNVENQLQEALLKLEEANLEVKELQNVNREESNLKDVLEGRIHNLVAEVKSLSDECASLKYKVKTCDEIVLNNKDLYTEIENLKMEFEKRNEACKEFENLWQEQKQVTHHLQQELFTLQLERDNRMSELNTLQKENTFEHENSVKQLENVTAENESLSQKLTKVQNEFDLALQEWSSQKDNWHKNLEELGIEKNESAEKMCKIEEEMVTERLRFNLEKEKLLKELENSKMSKEESLQESDTSEVTGNVLLLQLTEAMKNIKQLEIELLATRDQKQELTEELLQVRDLQKFLEDEVKELREECEKTKMEIKRLDADLENDCLHIRRLEKELRETEEREHTSSQEVEALRHHLMCMEEALEAAEQQLTEKHSLMGSDISLYIDKLNQVESEYQNAVGKIIEMQNEAKEFASEHEKLRQENISLKGHISELSSVMQNRTDEMKTEEWEKEKSYLEEQLTLLKENNEKLNSEILELRATLIVFRGSMDEITSVTDSDDTGNAHNTSNSELHTDLSEKVGVAPLVKVEATSEVDELLNINEALRTDLQQVTDRATELQEIVDTKSQMMEKMLIEMNNLLSQIDNLQAAVQEKDDDLESVAEKLKRTEITLQEKADSCSILRQENDELLVKSRDAENELQEVIQKNDELSEQLSMFKHHQSSQDEKVQDAVKCEDLKSQVMMEGQSEKEELQYQVYEKTVRLQECETNAGKSSNCLNEDDKENDRQSDLKTFEREDQGNELEMSRHAEGNMLEIMQRNEMLSKQVTNLMEDLEISKNQIVQDAQNFEELLHLAKKEEQVLKSANQDLQQEVDKLIREREELKNNLPDHSDYSSMKTTICDLEDQIERLNRELKSHSSKENLQLITSEGSEEDLKIKLIAAEEKMVKFKSLAVKAKKEIAEIKRERDSVVKQVDELSSLSRQHVLNFQSLQVEYDKLQDEHEAVKDVAAKLSQEMTTLVSEVNSFKEQIVKLKSENEKLQLAMDAAFCEKKIAEQAKSEAESKVIILKSEKESEQKKIEVAKNECNKASQRIKSLEEQLNEEKERHKQTTRKLENKLQETKQQSVLDLEIADYEHTIQDLNEKIELKNIELLAFQEEISRQAERISNLMEQIGFLEGQHDVEEDRAKGLKTALTKVKEEAADLREQSQQQQKQIAIAQMELETVTAVKEDFQIQLGESAAEISNLKDSLRNFKETQARTANSYETRLASLEEELSHARNQIDSTQQEFESYKVRVHNVLKQKQQPVPLSPIDQEQKQRLEKSVEQMKLKLQRMNDELHTQKIEMGTLQQEHEHLLARHTKVVNDLQQKDDSWISRMDQLKKEHEHHQIMWESQKQQLQHQMQMVETSYKKQVLDQEMLLKTKISQLNDKLAEKEKELNSCQRENNVSNFQLLNDDVPFDILSHERQEGEGSECADSVPRYKPLSLATIPTSGFIPLEKLLQSTSDNEMNETMNQDPEALATNLSAAYRKLDHLTELLNESEAGNMRMSEQVRILKEEIRRLERNREREEHINNLEYLKNIVLKFLLLQGSSERQRLLPVLSTILRLSPEEQAQIQATTIGPSTDSNTSAWGGYLHRWSGLM